MRTLREVFVGRTPVVDGQSDEGMAHVRAATEDLYPGSTSGFGNWSFMPTLTFSKFKSETELAGDVATSNALLMGPLWRIATRMGALPIKVYSIDDVTGERSEENDHPGYELLRRPNPALTRNLLVSGTVMSMMLYGRAGWLKTRSSSGGPPVELWPLPGNRFKPLHDERSLFDGFELSTTSGERVRLKPEDVCYFRLMVDPETWTEGMSLLTSLADVATYGHNAVEASSEFFEKSVLGRLWVDMQGKELSNVGRRRLQAQMEMARRDRFGIPILEDGAFLREMGAPPDGQMLTSAVQDAKRVIAETLGLPELGSADYMRMFYGEVIQPIADAFEQELERSLMVEWDDTPAFPEFQFRELLAGDPLQRAQLHHTLIMSGQETLDEARKAENKAPYPNDSGAHAFIPLNLVPIDFAEQQAATNLAAAEADLLSKDTEGGLGGQEGKGTIISGTPPTVNPKALTQKPSNNGNA